MPHVHRLDDHEPKPPATFDEIAELLRPISELAKAILAEQQTKAAEVKWDDSEPQAR
jgi:hypothetical protein